MRKKKEQAEIIDQEIISVGHCLEAGRKAKGLSIEVASKSLCITKKILTRLEKECDDMPRDVYTVGFVRSYATFLGLDADPLVSAFRGNASISLIKTGDESKFPSPLPQAGIPRFKYIAASVVLLVILVVGAQYGSPSLMSGDHSSVASEMPLAEQDNQPENVTLVNDAEETPALIPDESVDSKEVSQTSPSDETTNPSKDSVVMKISQESWVEVTDPSGRVIISRVFKKGESYPFEATLTDFKIHTGNAGGISLVLDDYQTPALGKQGEIKRNISYSIDKLRAESSKAVKPAAEEGIVPVSTSEKVTDEEPVSKE